MSHRVVRIAVAIAIVYGVASCAGEEEVRAPAAPAPAAAEEAKTEEDQAAEEVAEESVEEPAGEVAAPAADERDILEVVSPSARASYERGLTLIRSDVDAALVAFQDAARENPEFFVAHYNAGALLQRQGQREAAKAAYERAIKARPGYSPAVAGLALLILDGGDVAGAESLLRRHAKEDASAVPVRAALASVLVRRGNLEQAREYAIGVLRQDERNAQAMLAMGMLYRRQKMFELSTLALNQAIGIDAGLGEAYAELGLVLVAQDEKPKAVAAFEKAAGASPHIAAILNNLGALRNEVGAFKGAIEVLERAVSLEPERATYHLNLGNAYRGEQRYLDAEKTYKKALEVGGGTSEALFNLGVLYLDNEFEDKDNLVRYQECVSYLKSYQSKVKVGAKDQKRIAEYIETAEKAIQKEEKRREREERRARERAEQEAEEAKRAAEAPPPAEPEPEAVPDATGEESFD